MNRDVTGLSNREQQIVARLAQGKNCREIADELGLKYGTVEATLYRLRKKIGVSSKKELSRHADVYALEGFSESL